MYWAFMLYVFDEMIFKHTLIEEDLNEASK